jgi:hypothetical protein
MAIEVRSEGSFELLMPAEEEFLEGVVLNLHELAQFARNNTSKDGGLYVVNARGDSV